ncbi:MAG: hypothetical protein AB7F74_27485 [Parvibaculaceae bacterium]
MRTRRNRYGASRNVSTVREGAQTHFMKLYWHSLNYDRPENLDSNQTCRAPGLANVWCGYGHNHVGLTLATATARIIARMMAGEEVAGAVRWCEPGRFG